MAVSTFVPGGGRVSAKKSAAAGTVRSPLLPLDALKPGALRPMKTHKNTSSLQSEKIKTRGSKAVARHHPASKSGLISKKSILTKAGHPRPNEACGAAVPKATPFLTPGPSGRLFSDLAASLRRDPAAFLKRQNAFMASLGARQLPAHTCASSPNPMATSLADGEVHRTTASDSVTSEDQHKSNLPDCQLHSIPEGKEEDEEAASPYNIEQQAAAATSPPALSEDVADDIVEGARLLLAARDHEQMHDAVPSRHAASPQQAEGPAAAPISFSSLSDAISATVTASTRPAAVSSYPTRAAAATCQPGHFNPMVQGLVSTMQAAVREALAAQ